MQACFTGKKLSVKKYIYPEKQGIIDRSGKIFWLQLIFYPETPTFAVLSQAAGMVPGWQEQTLTIFVKGKS